MKRRNKPAMENFAEQLAPGWKRSQGLEAWAKIAWKEISPAFKFKFLFLVIFGIYFIKVLHIAPVELVLLDRPFSNQGTLADANEFDLVSTERAATGNMTGVTPLIAGGSPFGWTLRPHHRIPVLAAFLGEKLGRPYTALNFFYLLLFLTLPFLVYGATGLIYREKSPSFLAAALAAAGIGYFLPYSHNLIEIGRLTLFFSPFFALYGLTLLGFSEGKVPAAAGGILCLFSYLLHPGVFWFMMIFLIGVIIAHSLVKKFSRLFWIFLFILPLLVFYFRDFQTFSQSGLMAGPPDQLRLSFWGTLSLIFPQAPNGELIIQTLLRGALIILGFGALFLPRSEREAGRGFLETWFFFTAMLGPSLSLFFPVTRFFETFHLLNFSFLMILPAASFGLSRLVFQEIKSPFIIGCWVLWFLLTRQIAAPETLPHMHLDKWGPLTRFDLSIGKNSPLLIEDHPLLRAKVARIALKLQTPMVGSCGLEPLLAAEKEQLFRFAPETGRVEWSGRNVKAFSVEEWREKLKRNSVSFILGFSPQANESLSYRVKRDPNLVMIPGWAPLKRPLLYGIFVGQKKISDGK